MSERKVYKVVAPIEKRGGGQFWLRCGSAMVNRDNSINVYLDAMPKDLKFTLRELDEEDLRRRDEARAAAASRTGGAPSFPLPIAGGDAGDAGNDNAPF